MNFDAKQVDALGGPLSRDNVKTREQAGRKLSYIEGWVAIREANRIFGFGAWSRQTIELKCVSEHERTIGTQKSPGWGVTYISTVRVTVGDIIREGSGTGHGIDRDQGQAHESALKEAETDAMKRALMTFGNPFGLALYDKEQMEVESAPRPEPMPGLVAQPAMTPEKWANMAIDRIKGAKDQIELDAFTDKFADKIAKLRVAVPALHAKIIAGIQSRHAEFAE